jgi:hypothetical protein
LNKSDNNKNSNLQFSSSANCFIKMVLEGNSSSFETLVLETLDEEETFGINRFASSSYDCLFVSVLRKLDKFCKPRYENACSID